MRYIRVSKVKERIHGKGKRATRGFILWLYRRVETIVDKHIHMLGSRSSFRRRAVLVPQLREGSFRSV
jgi:hypothetical protein